MLLAHAVVQMSCWAQALGRLFALAAALAQKSWQAQAPYLWWTLSAGLVAVDVARAVCTAGALDDSSLLQMVKGEPLCRGTYSTYSINVP